MRARAMLTIAVALAAPATANAADLYVTLDPHLPPDIGAFQHA